MNGDPAESIRRIKQKRAVSRTIEPLIERGFDSLIVLRENLRDPGTVNERAAIRAKARLILRAAGQRRVVSERRHPYCARNVLTRSRSVATFFATVVVAAVNGHAPVGQDR